MKLKKILQVITVGFLVTAAGNAVAEGKGKGMKGGMDMPKFSDFDANGDGKISEQEFNEFHAARMSKMAQEGRKMKHAGKMPGFSDIDTNADDFINEHELTTHQAEHHEQMQQHKKS